MNRGRVKKRRRSQRSLTRKGEEEVEGEAANELPGLKPCPHLGIPVAIGGTEGEAELLS